MDKFEQKLKDNCVGCNMEIEKKYIFAKDKADDVVNYILGLNGDNMYDVEFGAEKRQIDTYFDTQDLALMKADCTLRVRNKDDKFYITCKRPIESASNGINGQLEREENEEIAESGDLRANKNLVENFLTGIPNAANLFDELNEKIRICNNRTKVVLKRKLGSDKITDEIYEVVIDNVEYENLGNKKKAYEYQLEIELKSSYRYRINMKKLTDSMERELLFLEAIQDSKYQRALAMTRDGDNVIYT